MLTFACFANKDFITASFYKAVRFSCGAVVLAGSWLGFCLLGSRSRWRETGGGISWVAAVTVYVTCTFEKLAYIFEQFTIMPLSCHLKGICTSHL